MPKKGQGFEKLFMEAVDEGLKVLGESGKQMVFFHLEKSYSLKKDEIPKKPEVFMMGLRKIFGAGAAVLEKLILEALHSKLGLKYESESSYSFADYLDYTKYQGKGKNNRSTRATQKVNQLPHLV
jgi:hypothetical protein